MKTQKHVNCSIVERKCYLILSDKNSEHSSIICSVWPNSWGSTPVEATSPSEFAPASSKEFLDIQATIECRFTLKCVRDMTRTYCQMHCTDKNSEHSSIIWPVWPNDWVFD